MRKKYTGKLHYEKKKDNVSIINDFTCKHTFLKVSH